MKVTDDQIRRPMRNDPKESVKEAIMAKFRQIKADVGDTLPSRWLNLKYLPSLNPKEKAVFDEVRRELIDSDLVEVKGDTLALTQKGVDYIYK